MLEVQLTEGAVAVPNLKIVRVLPTAKPVPRTVTVVPPDFESVLGVKLVIAGKYMKRLEVSVLVPVVVVTVTSTVPAGSAGDTAVIDVDELTV